MTMGYYKRADLPFRYALADAFTLCDGYHCSILGPTHPNRLMANSGTIDPAGKQGGPVTFYNRALVGLPLGPTRGRDQRDTSQERIGPPLPSSAEKRTEIGACALGIEKATHPVRSSPAPISFMKSCTWVWQGPEGTNTGDARPAADRSEKLLV
jgi:hypothetical protein